MVMAARIRQRRRAAALALAALPVAVLSAGASPDLAVPCAATAELATPVIRGAAWTTDAPFRETAEAIESATARGCLAVEMEAAALYAFAHARARPVVCFAHVTNQMGQIEGDFEKGLADGATHSLEVLAAAARAWRAAQGR